MNRKYNTIQATYRKIDQILLYNALCGVGDDGRLSGFLGAGHVEIPYLLLTRERLNSFIHYILFELKKYIVMVFIIIRDNYIIINISS